MWWIALILIIVGVAAWFSALRVEGVEAPQPTPLSERLYTGSYIAIALGVVTILGKLAFVIASAF